MTPSKADSTSNTTKAAPSHGVYTRIGQRILALTAAVWHNDRIGHTIQRSLTPYDR